MTKRKVWWIVAGIALLLLLGACLLFALKSGGLAGSGVYFVERGMKQ